MQCPTHILDELDRAVGAWAIRYRKLELTFIRHGTYCRIIIRLHGRQRIKIHLAHGREIQLECSNVANCFFVFHSDCLTNGENNRIRAPAHT